MIWLCCNEYRQEKFDEDSLILNKIIVKLYDQYLEKRDIYFKTIDKKLLEIQKNYEIQYQIHQKELDTLENQVLKKKLEMKEIVEKHEKFLKDFNDQVKDIDQL